jgi:methyltransferase (TIGR00027 family)
MKSDRPSSTALLVAAGVAFQSTHPRHRHLVDAEAARLTREFVAAAGLQVRHGDSAADRVLVGLQEALTVRGLTLQYVLRKRRIEQMVRAAITAGYRQLIVLGAGLDTLAIRLANEITAIEIDHPATQQLKKSVARDANVEFLAVDFARESVSEALRRSARCRANEPALFLAEAVLLYLTEQQVRNLFAQLRARTADTRLIFTFWEPRDPINFQNATWVADWYLRRHAEPGRWAIAPENVSAFAREEGAELYELARDVDFHEGFRAARGEHIAAVRWPR